MAVIGKTIFWAPASDLTQALYILHHRYRRSVDDVDIHTILNMHTAKFLFWKQGNFWILCKDVFCVKTYIYIYMYVHIYIHTRISVYVYMHADQQVVKLSTLLTPTLLGKCELASSNVHVLRNKSHGAKLGGVPTNNCTSTIHRISCQWWIAMIIRG